MSTYNPLLHHCGELLPYSSVRAHHLEPAMQQVLNEARSTVEVILISQRELPTWDDFVVPLDALGARMSWCIGTLMVLARSRTGSKWTKAFGRCALIKAQFDQLLWGNEQLHALYQKLATSQHARQFSRPRQVLLERVLRRFRLAGMELAADQYQRFKALGDTLVERRARFNANTVSAARCSSWLVGVTDEALLEGVPAPDKAIMALYKDKELQGWRVDVSDPELLRTIMTYAQSPALRETVYQVSNALASDQGLPGCKTFDNTAVLEQLLKLRQEQARMLGFKSSAELGLQGLAVHEVAHVVWFFIQQMQSRGASWLKQRRELISQAGDPDVKQPDPWDYSFLAQQARLKDGALDEEAFRAHFELERVLEKMLDLPRRLFGIEFVERQAFDTWHASVRAFEVQEAGQTIGYLFLDLFARDEKPFKTGSMFSIGHRVLSVEGRKVTMPMAVLSCSLPAVGNDPVLLRHGQLRMLFHEFGHCLQQLLDTSETWQLSFSEHSGLDVLEFFSKLMECWCCNVEFLVDMSRHHQTGASLSDDQARRLRIHLESQSWMNEAAQLLYASIDCYLHLLPTVDTSAIRALLKENVELWTLPMHERFIYSFTHLASHYGGRYFTYLWGMELAKEVFARFEEKGLFDAVEGRRLRAEIYQPATTRSLPDSIEAFLGRPTKFAMQDSDDPDFKELKSALEAGPTGDDKVGDGSDSPLAALPQSLLAWNTGGALPAGAGAPAPTSVGVGRS